MRLAKLRNLTVAALILALLAAVPAPARAADCSALTTGIDRGKLIFFVEDATRADAIGAAWYALEGRLGRAADWLRLAPYRDGDATEAIVNARKTADFAEKEVARLRAELKELPEKGPSFPPVFFWPDGWMKLAFAVLDSLSLQAKYLRDEANAMADGNADAVRRITEARNNDLSGFDSYFAAFDREMVELLPAEHPEHLLMSMRVHWHGLFDLYAARDAATGTEAIREASLNIIEKLNEVAREIDADIPKIEGTFGPHRARLEPFMETLACDAGEVTPALDRYMATYQSFLPLARQTVELLRDYARIEVDFMNNGPSKELYDRYDAVSFRYENVVKKASAQWSERAKILAELIAK